ncbi:MAG: ATP-binding protein, partial [bacterium]
PAQLRRFLGMLAHYHGSVYNANELASSLGISKPTARKLLDLACGAFFARQLQPFHANMGKRLVKSPKVYLRDSGLYHTLLGVDSMKELRSHPKLGASWEGFALEQVLALCGDQRAYFWSVHNGPELDLLLEAKGKRWGFEFKAHSAPDMPKSGRAAAQALKLERLFVVHPGDANYPLGPETEALAFKNLPADMKRMGLVAEA